MHSFLRKKLLFECEHPILWLIMLHPVFYQEKLFNEQSRSETGRGCRAVKYKFTWRPRFKSRSGYELCPICMVLLYGRFNAPAISNEEPTLGCLSLCDSVTLANKPPIICPNSPHSQGALRSATQISPLLNFIVIPLKHNKSIKLKLKHVSYSQWYEFKPVLYTVQKG